MASLKYYNPDTGQYEYVRLPGNAAFSGLIGDGTSNPITIYHGLGTTDVIPVCVRTSDNVVVDVATFTIVDVNQVRVNFASAPTVNQYRVIIQSAVPSVSPVGNPRSSGRWEQTSDQSVPTGADTKIAPLGRQDHNDDSGGLWSMNQTTGELTINVGGVYRFNGTVLWRSVLTGHETVAAIMAEKGGVFDTLARHNTWEEPGNFSVGNMLASGPVYIESGTKVYIEVRQNTGNSKSTFGTSDQYSFLSVESVAGNTILDGRYHQRSVGKVLIDTVYFTSSGSFVKANYPGARFVKAKVQGGGGGGGGALGGGNSAGGGGGAGGYAEKMIDLSTLAASETVTVGGGGNGAAAGQNNGVNGTASSFVGVVGSGGGQGIGGASQGYGYGGSNGTATGGDLNIPGGSGGRGIAANNGVTSIGLGGVSHLGTPGLPFSSVNGSDGAAGQGYGAGGGGGISGNATNRTGGNGAPGIVILEVYG